MSEIERQREEFRQWATEQLEHCSDYIHDLGLLPEDPRGKGEWAIPERVFLGRIYSAGDPDQAYWVITGPEVPTDHIGGEVAPSAREAVRHFALKWQLQGARVSELSSGDEEAGETPGEDKLDWASTGSELAAKAEALYELSQDDRVWPPESDLH